MTCTEPPLRWLICTTLTHHSAAVLASRRRLLCLCLSKKLRQPTGQVGWTKGTAGKLSRTTVKVSGTVDWRDETTSRRSLEKTQQLRRPSRLALSVDSLDNNMSYPWQASWMALLTMSGLFSFTLWARNGKPEVRTRRDNWRASGMGRPMGGHDA